MWFSSPKHKGIKFGDYFRPIPLPTIALIFTAVEFILTQWASGVYKPSATFTEKVYTEVYQRHLSSLKELKVRSDIHAHKFLRIWRRLYARARDHAGVAANITDRPLRENDIDTFVTTTNAENTESEDELSDSGKEDEGEEDEDEE
ncbi:hypothetical protein M422DRAFT_253805 [Sphaerobolus stellatus SS14]|uniref:DUF6532 domain-containing protein n=1 Tax=Sphaerobolus stellatus (strain SS14) TaxID=990650 RepID=A0A0C9VX94_SPHS4|nr:hypothetical protein M422DRAFT_253805 [Sphaerobolus stellatus SS14]